MDSSCYTKQLMNKYLGKKAAVSNWHKYIDSNFPSCWSALLDTTQNGMDRNLIRTNGLPSFKQMDYNNSLMSIYFCRSFDKKFLSYLVEYFFCTDLLGGVSSKFYSATLTSSSRLPSVDDLLAFSPDYQENLANLDIVVRWLFEVISGTVLTICGLLIHAYLQC